MGYAAILIRDDWWFVLLWVNIIYLWRCFARICWGFKWVFYWTKLDLVGICCGFVVVNCVYLYRKWGNKLNFG